MRARWLACAQCRAGGRGASSSPAFVLLLLLLLLVRVCPPSVHRRWRRESRHSQRADAPPAAAPTDQSACPACPRPRPAARPAVVAGPGVPPAARAGGGAQAQLAAPRRPVSRRRGGEGEMAGGLACGQGHALARLGHPLPCCRRPSSSCVAPLPACPALQQGPAGGGTASLLRRGLRRRAGGAGARGAGPRRRRRLPACPHPPGCLAAWLPGWLAALLAGWLAGCVPAGLLAQAALAAAHQARAGALLPTRALLLLRMTATRWRTLAHVCRQPRLSQRACRRSPPMSWGAWACCGTASRCSAPSMPGRRPAPSERRPQRDVAELERASQARPPRISICALILRVHQLHHTRSTCHAFIQLKSNAIHHLLKRQ